MTHAEEVEEVREREAQLEDALLGAENRIRELEAGIENIAGTMRSVSITTDSAQSMLPGAWFLVRGALEHLLVGRKS